MKEDFFNKLNKTIDNSLNCYMKALNTDILSMASEKDAEFATNVEKINKFIEGEKPSLKTTIIKTISYIILSKNLVKILYTICYKKDYQNFIRTVECLYKHQLESIYEVNYKYTKWRHVPKVLYKAYVDFYFTSKIQSEIAEYKNKYNLYDIYEKEK